MNVYTTLLVILLAGLFSVKSTAQIILPYKQNTAYPKSNVSYSDFENLMAEVKDIRAKRLVSFAELKAYQAAPNTVLLDTRSRDRFKSRHLKGAINLPYTDFTEQNLRKIIPDVHTRILIYCNNNFEGDEVDFASKGIVLTAEDIKKMGTRRINTIKSSKKIKRRKRKNKKTGERKNRKTKDSKQIMLALNVPTYITLHGYGYRNIFELDELVDVRKAKADFEGTKNGLTRSVRVIASTGKK